MVRAMLRVKYYNKHIKQLPKTSAVLYEETKQASSPNNFLSKIDTAVGGIRDVLCAGESNLENPDIAETSRQELTARFTEKYYWSKIKS